MTKRTRAPIAPKAHGAWLGAGTGLQISAVIVGIVETYNLHHAMPAAGVRLVDTVVTITLALLGAYLAPHQVRPGDARPADAGLDILRPAQGEKLARPGDQPLGSL